MNRISCDLKCTDVEHLVKLYKALNVKLIPRLDSKLNRARLTITNKKIAKDLIKCGCIPNKSLVLKFPDERIFASKDLIRHFIRGYFDGDGCISYLETKYCRPRCTILGTKSMLESIEFYSNTK